MLFAMRSSLRTTGLSEFVLIREKPELVSSQVPSAIDSGASLTSALALWCPVPLTVRGTQALVSFAPLAFKLFYAARQNAVLRRSPFVGLNNVGGDPPSAVVDAATIAARLNGP